MKRICLLLETLNDATPAVNERIGQIEKAGGVITDIKFQPRPPPSSRMIFCIIYDISADPDRSHTRAQYNYIFLSTIGKISSAKVTYQ